MQLHTSILVWTNSCACMYLNIFLYILLCLNVPISFSGKHQLIEPKCMNMCTLLVFPKCMNACTLSVFPKCVNVCTLSVFNKDWGVWPQCTVLRKVWKLCSLLDVSSEFMFEISSKLATNVWNQNFEDRAIQCLQLLIAHSLTVGLLRAARFIQWLTSHVKCLLHHL